MALIHQKAVERIAVLPDSNLFRPPYTHKYTYLYRTTNEVNDKYYIGIHGTDSNPLTGWDGYLGSGTVLNQAIEKHGAENFVHKPLAIFGDRKFAFLMEKQYISKCIDDPMCYNIAPGGEGGLGWNESLKIWEQRDPDAYYAHWESIGNKISKVQKEVWSDPEYGKRQSEAHKKAWADPELRKRQSETVKKLWEDPEYKERQSEMQKEVWSDPELRKRQSETVKEAWKDPELRKRNSEAQKRVWANPEYKERQSKALKKAWSDPELRKRQSESIRETPMSEKDLAYRLRRVNSRIDRLSKLKQTPGVLKQLDDARLNLHRVTKLLNEFGED